MEVGEAHGYHLAVLDRFSGWFINADCGVDDLSRLPAVAAVVREMLSEDVDGDLGLGRIEPNLVLESIAEMAAWGLGCDSNQLELPFVETGRAMLNYVIDQKGI